MDYGQLKEIEIPFGAKDSELYGCEYTIPEGMEATIVGNKIVVKKKESNDDRIRKELLEHCKNQAKPYIQTGNKCPQIQSWIDWLEKQGEQKPTDKVEPKFKVGDFIVNDYCMGRIVEITNDAYLLDTEQGIPFSGHSTRLWDIAKDAKEGDVLACENGWTCIFKALDNHTNTFSSYCFMDKDKWFCNTGSECHTLKEEFVKAYNGKIYPATKEQRDTLFAKMKEAGYEWDADKKELKKIEQKPAWSEEDEMHIRELESLVKQVWATAEHENDKNTIHKMSDLSFFLKTLKPQLKQEWSEEDKAILEKCIGAVKVSCYSYSFKSEAENWLKSLKPQNTWKPSDEQMNLLEELVEDNNQRHFYTILRSLYEQLKKLREE